MSKTKTIYFLSAFVLIIGCYALNLSYSLFTQTVTPENNTVDATVPYLSASLETNTFSIAANDSKAITLKIINSGTSDINYGISVSDTKGTTIQLVETYDIVGKLSASTTEGETASKEVLVYVTNPTDTEITDLTFDLTTNYTTISFDEETFISNSNIDTVNTIKLLNSTLIARAKSITENDSKTNGYAMYSETLRTSLGDANAADESLLLTADDDYTGVTGEPSYYFRGNVKDNFVNFAGMCWRIVRVNGDGSVKLILEDQFEQCNDREGYDLNDNGTYFTGNWNTVYHNNLSNVESVLNSNLDKMKGGDWCSGDVAYADSNSDINIDTPLTDIEKQEYQDNYMPYFYDPYIRLPHSPTFKCNGTIRNEHNGLPIYTGAITADEVVFAGSTFFEKGNPNYYLTNDYQKNSEVCWYTDSLSFFMGSGDYYFNVLSDGTLYDTDWCERIYYRAAINLSKTSIIEEGGDGTQNNPYVIK